jgi:hypothetical protein
MHHLLPQYRKADAIASQEEAMQLHGRTWLTPRREECRRHLGNRGLRSTADATTVRPGGQSE